MINLPHPRFISVSISVMAIMAMTSCTSYMPVRPAFSLPNTSGLPPAQLQQQASQVQVKQLQPLQLLPPLPSQPMQPQAQAPATQPKQLQANQALQLLPPVQTQPMQTKTTASQPLQTQPMQPVASQALPTQPIQANAPVVKPLPTQTMPVKTAQSKPLQKQVMQAKSPQELAQQKEQLITNLKAADSVTLALNDKKFLKKVLKSRAPKLNNEQFSKLEQCVYYNIDREQYNKDLPEVAQFLMKNYPESIDNYITALDTLKTVVNKVYNHPTPLSFNIADISQSTALTILSPYDRDAFVSIVNDPAYAPILVAIGLPAKKEDGTLADMNTEQAKSIIGYIDDSLKKCQ